jgi:hypothetical protein
MRQVVDDCRNPWVPTFNGVAWPLRRITRDQDGTAIKIENVSMTASQLFREIVEAAWSNGKLIVVIQTLIYAQANLAASFLTALMKTTRCLLWGE